MYTTRAWMAAALMMAGACRGEPPHDPRFEINAGDHMRPITEMTWPPDSGEFVTANNSVLDPAGLGGLEIEAFTPDGVKHAINAADFIGRLNQVYGPVRFDGYGEVRFTARIRQDDAVVAEGAVAWTVDPDGHDGWEVAVLRIPPPQYYFDMTAPEPCIDAFACITAAHAEIDESARNYPDEAFWIIVRRDDWGAMWN